MAGMGQFLMGVLVLYSFTQIPESSFEIVFDRSWLASSFCYGIPKYLYEVEIRHEAFEYHVPIQANPSLLHTRRQ